MTTLHYFSIKDEVQAPKGHASLVLTMFLEAVVDIWLEENQINGFIKSKTIEHKRDGRVIAFTPPDWAFFNERDALQFKLRFADQFDYCFMGAE